MKHNLFVMLKFCVVSFAVIPLVSSKVYSQEGSRFVDKVEIGEARTRYYLHFDINGNSPKDVRIDMLKGVIKAGNEIDVRFYPNSLFEFNINQVDIPGPKSKDTSAIFFPSSQPDTFSIQYGYGAVYFITNMSGSYTLRIAGKSSGILMGKKADENFIKKETNAYNLTRLKEFEEVLKKNGYDDKWKVWAFKDIYFEKGTYCIEVYELGGTLLARLDAVQATDIYQNTSTIIQNDLSNSIHLPLEKDSHQGFYHSIINSANTVAGILSFNVVYDYSKDSWNYKQAPVVSKDRKLFYENKSIEISKVQQLPGSIRIRAGFGVFNNLTEVRLVSNFVLVMNPESYFAKTTPFLDRINPTLGLQVGGTGSQDLIFLTGLSFKLINEGDLVFGFRFIGDGIKWQIGRNFYFGITLDPGLFGQLTNK